MQGNRNLRKIGGTNVTVMFSLALVFCASNIINISVILNHQKLPPQNVLWEGIKSGEIKEPTEQTPAENYAGDNGTADVDDVRGATLKAKEELGNKSELDTDQGLEAREEHDVNAEVEAEDHADKTVEGQSAKLEFEEDLVRSMADDSGKIPALVSEDWIDADCLKPMTMPILGTHDMSRVLNMGFPKCGSSSISRLFQASGFNERHYVCGQHRFCGKCMNRRQRNNETMLDNCGNFTVFSQMDFNGQGVCHYPQIKHLHKLYNEAPNATWILPFRNVTNWIRSISHWDKGSALTLRKRITKWCDFPDLDFRKSKTEKTDEEFVELYCNHVKRIRNFVHAHPSLSLIEFSIEDPHTGEFLASVFPVDSKHWGHENKNKKLKTSVS